MSVQGSGPVPMLLLFFKMGQEAWTPNQHSNAFGRIPVHSQTSRLSATSTTPSRQAPSNQSSSAIEANMDTDNEIEIANASQDCLINQHSNLRQQIHIDPSHRDLNQRLNPTATHLASGQARNAAHSIYKAREICRESFVQAAAQGRDNFWNDHRDPMFYPREEPVRSTGSFSSALADPQQCGASAASFNLDRDVLLPPHHLRSFDSCPINIPPSHKSRW
ncbi:uncharacterized protein MELLADRAFT_93736 [Melampsora larici-populina 98AG31]|uniref:Uncharacterized protein n=1 Tax=Melampsora larici-populina (strain 98AG31 / pathotype 3-4-7) TaxID=747676 RepID=F4S530_MELLP|nr:uncharacterized protein MELLADRAFT_93736 [Melampsora larici-populina 98AG31]EGG00248.1 hypothetical protein MELLADRAFT_93736 [Melampsora larici-populina 98AG31]